MFGVVTFLAGAYFWSREPKARGGRTEKMWRVVSRAAAVVLFLLPTLGMVGYVARHQNVPWSQFFQELSRADAVGLTGLVAVAFVGIGLSRYYEGP